MTGKPVPEAPRRAYAIRTACQQLLAHEVRTLPPDPAAMVRGMAYRLITMREAGRILARQREAEFSRSGTREGILAEEAMAYSPLMPEDGEEACTLAAGKKYLIAYDDRVENRDRIRFSIFHELGHIQLGHFEDWNPGELEERQRRVLEEEANIFARNLLCPPPVLEMVRGDWRDPKWARLFCMSDSAWKVRRETMAVDRKLVEPEMAERLRIQFREYMYGRRCRDCGAVFTDGERRGRCPECGSKYLAWNPRMESMIQAAGHRHVAGATAEDLKPLPEGGEEADLAAYWRLARLERKPG